MSNVESPILVSLNEAVKMTSMSRTMINRLRAEGRFPDCVPVGFRRIAFVRSEVTAWIEARIAERDASRKSKLDTL